MKSSGAVSPATRTVASTAPVMRPLRAARMTTPSVTRQRGTPIASPDSRSSLGTRLRMSSVVRAITGSMMNARAMDPAKPE